MELKHRFSSILFFFLSVGLSSSTFISDDIFESHAGTGRNLLQAQKRPKFPAEECCNAFKDFACPYADEINDLTTDCASTMFRYINLYGKYPPGLFASKCIKGKKGLACPASAPLMSDRASTTCYGGEVTRDC